MADGKTSLIAPKVSIKAEIRGRVIDKSQPEESPQPTREQRDAKREQERKT